MSSNFEEKTYDIQMEILDSHNIVNHSNDLDICHNRHIFGSVYKIEKPSGILEYIKDRCLDRLAKHKTLVLGGIVVFSAMVIRVKCFRS
jgi:hypothetical protein